MTGLPDTRSSGPRRADRRSWLLAVPLAVLLGVMLTWLLPEGEALPPDRIYSRSIEDISVGGASGGGTPPFDTGTRVVGVRVLVRGLPPGGRLLARVERSGRASALGRLLGTGGIRAAGGADERLSVSRDGVSGIVAFEVESTGGGALPEGRYAVEIRAVPAGGGGEIVLARTHFRVGG